VKTISEICTIKSPKSKPIKYRKYKGSINGLLNNCLWVIRRLKSDTED